MRLVLSSSDFGNPKSKDVILKNLAKPISESKVLFFPNEKATSESIRSEKYYHWMVGRGFSRENVFIFDHETPEKFFDLDIDCIHVSGGNTFETLQRLRTCGADKAIVDYVKNRGVVYIGGSAGAHIVTQNIRHVLSFDENICGMTDFDGLKLFDGILFCHYTEERKAYYEKACIESSFPVYALTDEDSIVVDT